MSQVLRQLAHSRHVGLVLPRASSRLTSSRLQLATSTLQSRSSSSLLIMAPPNQDGPSSSQGPSRKRRNPFRGGHNNQGRPRRGPAHQNTTNSPQFATQSAAFATSTPNAAPTAAGATAAAESASPVRSASPVGPSFSSLAGLNRVLLDTIHQDMKMTSMTPVQAETIPMTLAGEDMLAQAKTGTGKTIAFLLPAISRMISQTDPVKDTNTAILVVSPTRELAIQIAEDAKKLLTRFPHYRVSVAVGGTNPNASLKALLKGAHIVVATPGRLLDHLGDAQVVRKMQRVQTLVLDEADRLLDMGFKPDIEKIVNHLSPKAATNRQGMLFSATINPRVHEFAGLVLGKNYKFVSTIPVGETQTHEHVPQSLIVVPTFSHSATGLLGALRREMAALGSSNVKAIVFAPTAAQVDFYADVLSNFKDLPPVSGVHSRLTQSRRTKITDTYRKAKSGILVATDVIARGLDFPGVTSVLQVGLPSDRESYIHRLGRTARAGADGRGTLVLAKDEVPFADKNLSIVKFTHAEPDLSAHADVLQAAAQRPFEGNRKTYQAWLGFYKTHMKVLRMQSADLVRQANTLALQGLGLQQVPALEKKTIGMMGLKGVPGLVIAPSAPFVKKGR